MLVIASVLVQRIKKLKRLFEVVKVLDVEPFEIEGGESFRFRFEIARALGESLFIGKVYRLETYRLQPTFPQSDGVVPDWQNDALLFVADETLNSGEFAGGSMEDVLTQFRSVLESVFGVEI